MTTSIYSFDVLTKSSSGSSPLRNFAQSLPPAISSRYKLYGPRKFQRLSFLLNYAEFDQLKTDGHFDKAARKLTDTLQNGMVPLEWWGIVLYDASILLAEGK